jgi:hypothetical protein
MGQHISSLVNNLFLRYDDWRFTLIKSWPSIFGPLSQYTRLERVDGSTLIIGVYDPHWMQELHLLAPTLIASVNNHLQKQVITGVKFKLAQRKAHTAPTIKKNSDEHQEKTIAIPHLTTHQQQALMDIKDPELKKALLTYFAYLKKGQTP